MSEEGLFMQMPSIHIESEYQYIFRLRYEKYHGKINFTKARIFTFKHIYDNRFWVKPLIYKEFEQNIKFDNNDSLTSYYEMTNSSEFFKHEFNGSIWVDVLIKDNQEGMKILTKKDGTIIDVD